MTPIDQRDPGMQGKREGVWKALSITMIVTQRLEMEERGGYGKVREKAQEKRKEREKITTIINDADVFI